MTEVHKRDIITLAEVSNILEAIPMEEMDQIQRWTYDYAKKFAKTKHDVAKSTVERLVTEADLTIEESVELINVMPRSIEELRAFTFGWKKLIVTEKLEKIKSILSSSTLDQSSESDSVDES